ncbi:MULTISPECIES: hypothetical protein [unclassified Streptomyces]|uniref:hypothetical protein n=1 Tax=unclassified Streptomyces TaxID=2593676 RepID=UPI000F47832C|nr:MULTISPECIES: hypothetical protein [unclassified Streptomyces]
MSQTTHPVVLFQKRLSGPGVMLLICNAMLLCMVIASLLFWQSHALLVTAVAYGTAVILWIGMDIGREASRERESIGESQQRLNLAERDFEEALRGEFLESAGKTPTQIEELRRRRTLARRRDGEVTDATEASGSESLLAPIASPPHLALAELWAATHARLALYHKIATGQAKQSFRNAQVAMWLGFVLLAGFLVVALKVSTTAGSIVAGGLGAVAAALAGFVSRTFVRSQEAAAGHLRSYFDQPLELSRYLAAERLIADAQLSDERRAEILADLVHAIVAGPPQPVAGDDAAASSQRAG